MSEPSTRQCVCFYSAAVGEQCIAISLSVCLCVCVCVCLSASISLEPLDRSSRIFCADPLWPGLGPPLAALRYVMYSGSTVVGRMAMRGRLNL